MNIDAYNHIIDTIEPILNQKSFSFDDELGYFKNDSTAYRVAFIEEKNLFELQRCELDEEKKAGDEWNTLSSWLFLPDYTVKDAKSIANDFTDTLQNNFGLKQKVNVNRSALPEKGSKDECSVNTLTARFLTIFPQFKEEYQKYVTSTGVFLYAKFYSEIGAPHLRELLANKDKKRLEKYFDTLNHHYCEGDKEVRSLVSSLIMVEAIGNDNDILEIANAYMQDYKYLLNATDFSLKLYKKGLAKNA
ncbi:MAG: hypothetical protein IJ944_03880 [Clostridia bacterium]|nr:hypothetical protein [Clostridia bacterium]